MELPPEVQESEEIEKPNEELTATQRILVEATKFHVEKIQRLDNLRKSSKTKTKSRYYEKKIKKLNNEFVKLYSKLSK